jgi:protein-tyrosine phosphatase
MDNPLRRILPARGREIRYTDLHCHILPGLDDGARDMKASLSMALMARESGARRIVATPHIMPGVYASSPGDIRAKASLLRENLGEAGIDLEIVEGAEVYLTEQISRDYKDEKILPLGRSRYILVELPSLSLPAHTIDEIFNLRIAGAGVILAHPERNSDLRRNPGLLREVVETGIYLQVNAGSFVGVYGKDVSAFADRLMKEGLVHFIGSDAHSGDHLNLLESGPDIRPALKRALRSSKDRERFMAALEERVEDLLSGRLE